jgi:hypothetical protein
MGRMKDISIAIDEHNWVSLSQNGHIYLQHFINKKINEHIKLSNAEWQYYKIYMKGKT